MVNEGYGKQPGTSPLGGKKFAPLQASFANKLTEGGDLFETQFYLLL